MHKYPADIVHFHRRPMPGNFSMENLFHDLREEMNKAVGIRVEECPEFSRGLIARLKNILWARKRQGYINHITGDVNYIALLMDPSRTILTIHDCVNLERLTGIRRWILKKLWFDWPIRRVRYVTVISEATKARLLELSSCPAEKIHVIYNPTSHDLKQGLREFNASKPVFLQVGTKSNKNLQRHVEAISGLNCELRIIGKLTDEQRTLLECHRIEYVNSYDLSYEAVIKEYIASDIVLFASTYEGFGLPIVEAQSVGRPVITSKTWSMPEVAGDGAILVDPESVDEIKAAILELISNSESRDELVLRGLKNVQRFKPGNISIKYLSLYEKITVPNSFGQPNNM